MYHVAGTLIMPQLEDCLKKIVISNSVARLQNALNSYTSRVIDTVENSKRDLKLFF